MSIEIKLSKEDMERINACVDLMILEKYRDAADLMEGCTDPLMQKLHELCVALHISESYLERLARGEIFSTVWPKGRQGGRILQQFYSKLYKILYQMKRFAEGDYLELSADMGDFSACYNDMLRHLRRRRTQAELSARQDSLTGLLKRRPFLEKAERRMREEPRYEGVMLVVSFDCLCDIADECGMDRCDKYVAGAAREFENIAEWGDLVGRVSENEFALYAHRPKKSEEILRELEALVRSVNEKSVKIENNDIPLNIASGVARYPLDHTAAHWLLEQAQYTARRRE